MAGWLWNSNTSNTPESDATEIPVAPAPASPSSTVQEHQPPPQPTPQPQPQLQRSAGRISAASKLDQLNRDEDAALAELKAALTDPYATSSSPHSSSSSHTSHEPSTEIPADSLYPTRLSCAQCFDAAYYCSSVGGQFTAIYRYGAMRSCSDLWAQWRFCMRTKTMGEEERRRKVWEWNREKEARRRVGRNSEEVWGMRTEGPPRGALGICDEQGGQKGEG